MAETKNVKKQQSKQTKSEAKKGKNTFDFLGNKYTGLIIGGLYILVMSIISFSFHKIGDYGIETDFFWSYVPQAQNFLDGNIAIDKYRGPLYPIVLGLSHLIIGDYFKTGMFLAIISAGLILFFTFELLKKLFSPLTAFITVLIVAVNTTFNLYTYSAGTDMFFNFLVTAGLFFLLRNKEYKWLNVLIAGLFAGLAYITRYNGIFILVTILAAVLFINIYKIEWKKRFIATAIFLAVFSAVIAPWGIYTYQKKGEAFFNQNYQNVAYEYIAKGEMSWDEFWYQGNRDKYTSLTQIILQEPGTFFSQFIKNGFDHLFRDLGSLIGWHISIFSLLGLILLFYHPPTKQQWTFYLANMLFFGVLLLVFYNERFSMFLIPFYTVFAVNFLFSENRFIKKAIVKSSGLTVLLALILISWTFGRSYKYNSENINSGDKLLPKIAKQFERAEPKGQRGDRIVSRKGHIAYYLGLQKTHVPPAKDYYQQVALLWKKGVDYAYYGMWEAGRGMDFLRDPNNVPPDFELIAYASGKNKMIRQKEDSKTPYKIEVQKANQTALLYKVKIDSVRRSIIDAGNWLMKQHPEKEEAAGLKIMSAVPYIAYYTGMQYIEMPQGDFSNLYETVSKKQVDYIYFGSIEVSSRMLLRSLIMVQNVPEWMEAVAVINQQGRFPGVIYKVKL